MVVASTTFVATGCAQRSQVLVWSPRGYIIYASAGELVIAHLKKANATARIVGTVAAHEADITCLTIDGDILRSGCAQGIVAVWRFSENASLELQEKYEAHPKHPITFCAGLGERTVSCASDGRLLIRRSVDKQQELRFGSTFVLCAAFHKCTDGRVLLAAATSNSKIEILFEEGEEFRKGITLTGHSDWVRSMAFRGEADDSIICASAGQDSVIRLYKFQNERNIPTPDPEELRVRPLKLEISKDVVFHVTVEAVLSGHEGWIHSVQWHPNANRLLSASIDKCLIVWEPSEGGSGVWLEKVRVGEVGGQAVGYYGAVFTNEGLRIVGHSYFGGIYVWHPENEENLDETVWHPEAAVGGHFSPVVDVDWDPTGSYLISCSSDQTTRTYAPIAGGEGYAEIGRPQVHGHNLNCLVSVSSSCFVSGAEEKIFRAFRAPITFANSLANLSRYSKDKIFREVLCEFGAGVPSLGLSNKAIEEGELTGDSFSELGGATKEEIAALISNPVDLTQPPTEDHLMQNTLWPEIHKLYGHGFEVFAIAANKSGTLIATSCKASHADHAAIMIWDTDEWQRRCDLYAHQLTVTQLAFSPSGRYLLSVSRDRSFAVFKSNKEYQWSKVFQSNKSTGVHSRIIWACSWSHDSTLFATVSRDKKMAIWRISDNGIENIAVTGLEESITAVQFAPELSPDGKYTIASGLENGLVEVFSFDIATGAFESLHKFDQSTAHSRTIRRLRFRPVEGPWQSGEKPKRRTNCLELASCSDDHCVKVHRIEWAASHC